MPRVRIAVVVAVLATWIATCAVAVFDPRLVTLAGLTTPVMTAVVGGIFGLELFERRGSGNGRNGRDGR